jgi:hypothetical protein
MTSGRPIYI